MLTLTPRPGVTLRVLVDRPAAPIGSVVLMAGGDGVLDLDAQGNIGSGLREQPPGAHARRLCGGGLCGVRSRHRQRPARHARLSLHGTDYASDVAAVIAEARKVAPPVAIVGTSRGALSVAAVFTKQSAVRPDAAVISSGMLMGNDGGRAVPAAWAT